MRTLDILKFSLRLILAKKTRNFLVILSILIGTAVLFLFFIFSNGVQNFLLKPIYEKTSPETLIISNDFLSLGFFDVEQGVKLNQTAVDKIKNFPEVASVGRMLTLKYPSSIKVWMFGFTFETDAPIFAVDEDFFGKDKPSDFKTFINNDGEEMLPIAISPLIIDAFNASLSGTVDAIPYLTPEEIYDKRFQVIFGKSTVFSLGNTEPIYRSAQIKMISPRVPMLGIAIPMDTALEVSNQLGGIEKDPVFSQVYVEAKSVDDVASLQAKIQEMGLKVETFGQVGEEVLTLILSLKGTLVITAILIIFVALLSMFSIISMSVVEQKQTIGILSAIGASKNTIFGIFITQGVILGIIGASLGLGIGTLISTTIDKFLLSKIPEISIKPETFFPLSADIFIWIFVAVIIASFVASFFPARRSAKITPLEAILS